VDQPKAAVPPHLTRSEGADRRDDGADLRDDVAYKRDRAADTRDHSAALRDDSAAERDKVAAAAAPDVGSKVSTADVAGAEVRRDEAALDRATLARTGGLQRWNAPTPNETGSPLRRAAGNRRTSATIPDPRGVA
jgi:hypothetical protein